MKGVLLALLTAVISGVAIYYSKISVAKIPPLILTTSRNFFVGALFFLMFIFDRRIGEIRKLKRRELIRLIFIGIIGGALPFYLFFTGLQFIPAIKANLIHKTLFIWVTVLGVFFLKERLNFSYIFAFILIGVANFYFGNLKVGFGKGELMIFSATVLWSLETIIAKKILKSVSSDIVGLFRMGIGGILLLAAVFITGKGSAFMSFNVNQVTTIVIGGAILFFYVFTWYRALKYAPAGLATLILTFSVVVGNILNGSFAGIKLVPQDIYTTLLIGSAVSIILFSYVIPNLFWNLFKHNEMLK